MSRSATAVVQFAAVPVTVAGTAIVRLPEDVSRSLPSRGQVAVRGTMDGAPFETVLEPDGLRGHWMRVGAEHDPADPVHVAFEIRSDWPEPDVPADLTKALAEAPDDIRAMWADITPMARWEWVRWVNATANPATRQRRVEVSISKMSHGKRRPCCFDLSACTDPALARSGTLRNVD